MPLYKVTRVFAELDVDAWEPVDYEGAGLMDMPDDPSAYEIWDNMRREKFLSDKFRDYIFLDGPDGWDVLLARSGMPVYTLLETDFPEYD